MKFIFPQNYKFRAKLFGIIDYQNAIISAIWGIIIFLILKIIFNNIKIKIFLFIVLVLPIILLSIIGIGGERISSVIIYIFKYILKSKLIFYSK